MAGERTQVYFGHSMEELDGGQQSEVKLTKFNVLPNEEHVISDKEVCGNSNEDHTNDEISENKRRKSRAKTENLKSLSVDDLFEKSMVANELLTTNQTSDSPKKWPWTMGHNKPNETVKSTHLDSIKSTPNLSNSGEKNPNQQQLATREPFKLVWRRLSFEVKVSAYDRLLNRAMRGVRGLWKLPNKHCNDKSKVSSSEKSISLHYIDELGQHCSAGADGIPKKRVIFEDLNGCISSGNISAILGPSGSGKTSLLNAICGRIENYRGSVQLVGGGKRGMRLSIIPQKDYLIENLTVRENLLYSSKILNTSKHFDHEANITRVVRMLNLINCFNSSAANISGGEYKRVSIAQELLRQPDILILDEPTSGLDSLNCKNLIKSLVQLIEASRCGKINPIAIVMTIHQPDIDIFQMFDHVYCMARRGRVIFDGRPGEALEVVRKHAGFPENELPPALTNGQGMSTNPANLLIEIASEDLYGSEPVDRLAQFQRRQFELQTSGAGRAQSVAAQHQPQPQQTVYVGKKPNLSSIELTPDNQSVQAAAVGGKFCSSKRQESLISVPTPSSLSVSSSTILTSSNSSLTTTKEAHLVRDKRLSAKNDHSGQFWHHTGLLARRAFTSTIRDPLMTIISMVFHLSIPFVMWTVYSQKTGSVGACPVIQREMDIISMISNTTLNMVSDLQEQLMTALECSTMFFLSTYSFSMCSLSIAALAFPLNMHVLLKEVRNGWYSLPSYVVAKTIANFPFEVLFPVISLIMIYVMLGMPSSYLEWRLWAMALVMALISMISHTQGLIFGALCMDSVQTAIFLASSSTLPLTLLSGFTARIKRMPALLQKLSWFSLYRYSSDSINIIRFGFGTCTCDDSTDEYLRTKQPVFSDIPDRAKPLFTYYIANSGGGGNSYEPITEQPNDNVTIIETISGLANSTNTLISAGKRLIPGINYELTLNTSSRNEMIAKLENNELDLFGRMANLLARSFSYGQEIDNCASVRSQLLTTADAPKDEHLPLLFGGMFALLIAAKLILFVIVKFKIGSRV